MTEHYTSFSPGKSYALGAHCTAKGVQFSIFSRNATEVQLLLFHEPTDSNPYQVFTLDPKTYKTGDIWHIHIHGMKPGELYLYKVDGPWDPSSGHRFNKLVHIIDPYAKALTNSQPWISWNQETMPKCIVVDDSFDWQGDVPLNYPLKDCVIYETHLGGLSKHSSAKATHPGTYEEVINLIPYFKKLGITSIEFLPIQEFNPYGINRTAGNPPRVLTDYWGYNTVAFFAPAAHFAQQSSRGEQVVECKKMIRELHKAGIEVILDIVFNHTAEGNELGPTFSFRGLDNSIYYMLDDSKQGYRNYSGCGNTMNCNHPIVRSMILHCIRYWVIEMHVDGFRFDLGSILGRDSTGALLRNPPVIEHLAEDPVLRDTKLIAEAWDAAGAYQVGNFHGERWAEWNDRFRDDIRQFWSNQPGMIAALAMRISGSSDLYSVSDRKPFHSINFITSHDGFTLNDLVSYEKKHNMDNGENNRDGHNANFSKNFGIEGPTDDPDIEQTRNRMVKNYLATLILSSGTPMILGGDEFRRSQKGNNNAYCQDNDIAHFNWDLLEKHADLYEFCCNLIDFRNRHHGFKRTDFFSGQDANNNGVADITWLDEQARPITWNSPINRMAVLFDGSSSEIKAPLDDNDAYLIFNATEEDSTFYLPRPPSETFWCRKIDTSNTIAMFPKGKSEHLENQKSYTVKKQSLVLLLSFSE